MAIKLRAVISKTRAAAKSRKVQDEFSDMDEESKPEHPLEVPSGPEIARILGLERRAIPDLESEDAQRVADFLTESFRLVPREELFPGPLLPVQGIAIREAWEAQGGFFQLGVGRGKSLVAFLVAALFDRERMLYVCQGDGTADAELKFEKYRRSWRGPSKRGLRVISYELLSNPSSAEELDESGAVVRPGRLERLRPEILILDESQNLASSSSAGARRVAQYLRGAPDTVVIALSGTPYRTSINDAAHILQWALKKNAPLPTDWTERMAWAGYLDAKAGLFGRTEIGELTQLADLYDVRLNLWDKRARAQDELRSQVRRLVARHILETPGVVGTTDPPLDIPLTMQPWYPQEEEALSEKILEMRASRCTPDGMAFADSKALARHEGTLALGYWTRPQPEPPAEWRQAKNAWAKWCRRAIKKNNRRIHTEALMVRAVRKGLYPIGLELWQAWEMQRDLERARTGLREPNVECVWESEEAVTACRSWASQYAGLIWVKHVGAGLHLQEQLGIPYYGAGGGLDAQSGCNIRDHRGGPALASIDACGVGKDLQHYWSNNLWLAAPNEQALARTHRLGQKAPVVRNFVYLGCARHLDSFNAARDVKEDFQSSMTLQGYKLHLAETSMPSVEELAARGGERWRSRSLDIDDEDDDFDCAI